MKLDKGTMAHGVETRVPYLDQELVEFAYNLPASFKRNVTADKFLLRHVAAKYLPKEIAYRKKRGFLLPIPEVLKENKDKIRDYVFSAGSFSQEFLTKAQLENLLRAKTPAGFLLSRVKETLLWKLFILEAWRKKFLGCKGENG